jgi:hypothetical protein
MREVWRAGFRGEREPWRRGRGYSRAQGWQVRLQVLYLSLRAGAFITPGRNESQTVASVKPTTAIVPPFRRFHSSNGSAGMALTSQWEMMCSRRRSLCKSTGMPNTLTRKWTWSAAGLEGMCVDPVQRSQCVRWSALRRRSLRMLLDHRSSTIQRPASPALNCILPTLHACRNS